MPGVDCTVAALRSDAGQQNYWHWNGDCPLANCCWTTCMICAVPGCQMTLLEGWIDWIGDPVTALAEHVNHFGVCTLSASRGNSLAIRMHSKSVVVHNAYVIGTRVIVMLWKCEQLQGHFQSQEYMQIFSAILRATYCSKQAVAITSNLQWHVGMQKVRSQHDQQAGCHDIMRAWDELWRAFMSRWQNSSVCLQ